MPNETQKEEFLKALEAELGGSIKQAEGAAIHKALLSEKMREFIGAQKAFGSAEEAQQMAMEEAFGEMNIMGNKMQIIPQTMKMSLKGSIGDMGISDSTKIQMKQELERLRERPAGPAMPKVDKEERAGRKEHEAGEEKHNEEQMAEEQQKQQEEYKRKQREQDQQEQEAMQRQQQQEQSQTSTAPSVKKSALKKVGAYMVGGAGVAVAVGAPIAMTLFLNGATKASS